VPEHVVRGVARELGVDLSGLGAYARGEGRRDHQAEIRREYGYREFHQPDVELELVRCLEARVRVSAESHRALFDCSVDRSDRIEVLLRARACCSGWSARSATAQPSALNSHSRLVVTSEM
jgi:hypothetical protein